MFLESAAVSSELVQVTPSERARADALLVLLTAGWATTFVVVKGALEDADPFTFLALRFTVGAIVASLFARSLLRHRESVIGGLVLSVPLLIGYVLQTVGLTYTTASRSAFFTGLAVLLVPFASVALFRRRPRGSSVIGVLFATAGLFLLTMYERGAELPTTWVGDALSLGCAAAYAVHITLIEKYAPRSHPSALVAVQLWIVALASAALIPFTQTRLVLSSGLVMAVLATGVFASALFIMAQAWAQQRTTAVRAAVIFSLEPVFASLFALALGEDALSRAEWFGGGLIVFGVLCSEAGGVWLDRRRAAALAR